MQGLARSRPAPEDRGEYDGLGLPAEENEGGERDMAREDALPLPAEDATFAKDEKCMNDFPLVPITQTSDLSIQIAAFLTKPLSLPSLRESPCIQSEMVGIKSN